MFPTFVVADAPNFLANPEKLIYEITIKNYIIKNITRTVLITFKDNCTNFLTKLKIFAQL